MTHALLIDTETLQQNLGQPGLVILDVRGRAAYEFGGHIPGAVHSTWHEYSDPHAVPTHAPENSRRRVGQVGARKTAVRAWARDTQAGDLHGKAGGCCDRDQRRTEAAREAAASEHRDRRCA